MKRKMVPIIRHLSRAKLRKSSFQRSQKSQRSFSVWISMYSSPALFQPTQIMILVSGADHIEEDILQRCILLASFRCAPTRSLTQFLQCSLGNQHPLIDDAYPRAEAFDHFHNM